MKVSIGIIPLTQGYEAIVDVADFEWISQHLWSAKVTRRTRDSVAHVHAVRTVETAAGRKQIYMHREIIAAADGDMIDHANHNGLDNRRSNLRLCTHADNNRNAFRQSRSGLRGVMQKGPRFYASIQVNKKRLLSRRCHSAEEAARLYDQMAVEHHGEFAVLNFPREADAMRSAELKALSPSPEQPSPTVA